MTLLHQLYHPGAGYGEAADRDPELVKRDLARGYISAEIAKARYGLSDADINKVQQAVRKGEAL